MTATRLYMKCHEVEREVCPLHFMIFHVEACSYHCRFISFIHLVMLKNISIKNCWLSLRWLWAFIFLYSFFSGAFLFFFGFGIISGNFCCWFWLVRKNFRNVTSIEILLAFFFISLVANDWMLFAVEVVVNKLWTVFRIPFWHLNLTLEYFFLDSSSFSLTISPVAFLFLGCGSSLSTTCCVPLEHRDSCNANNAAQKQKRNGRN